jgi:hypothetical protein
MSHSPRSANASFPQSSPAPSPVPSSEAPKPLDGRRFDGIVLERGKTSGDADTLIFQAGRFRSTACDRFGYGDGDYVATVGADAITFRAETESEKYGKLLWSGTVRGPRLDATLAMIRGGAAVGEKWVLAGER